MQTVFVLPRLGSMVAKPHVSNELAAPQLFAAIGLDHPFAYKKI
jgi:hypothetical protein